MERFILRFRGAAPTEAQLAELRQRVNVIDSSPKMLLFSAAAAELDRLTADFPQWTVAKEVTYQIPEKPIAVRKPASR